MVIRYRVSLVSELKGKESAGFHSWKIRFQYEIRGVDHALGFIFK